MIYDRDVSDNIALETILSTVMKIGTLVPILVHGEAGVDKI